MLLQSRLNQLLYYVGVKPSEFRPFTVVEAGMALFGRE